MLTEIRGEQHGQLLLALRPGEMRDHLGDAFHFEGDSSCHILDVKYEPGEYATILYEMNGHMVIGELCWKSNGGYHSARPEDLSRHQTPAVHFIQRLGMWAYRFPFDPALPGLATALDPRAMARTLETNLPECANGAARVTRCRVEVLRYRPGKRCTLRLEVLLREMRTGVISARTLFGKLYHKVAKAQAVFEEMQMLAQTAPVREGRVSVARAAAFLPELGMVAQTAEDGVPLHSLLGDARGWSGALRAAGALASLHTIAAGSRRERPIAAELARFAERAAKVASVDTILGNRMGELAAVLPAWLEYLPAWGAESVLVHGDCKPSQFLMGAERITLLDFDHAGIADPASDIGTFLATLRQPSIQKTSMARGKRKPDASLDILRLLEDAFLNEYARLSGCGDYLRYRVLWYQAVALLRKAYRSFARSPRSPIAGALVDQAWNCLFLLPRV